MGHCGMRYPIATDTTKKFCLAGDMANLYWFIQGLLEWPFSDLFFSGVSCNYGTIIGTGITCQKFCQIYHSFVISVISKKALCSKGFTRKFRDIFTWKKL